MVEPDFYFHISDNKVAHEIIDGEAIVIHFESGNYYSLQGIAAQLWQWFASRASRREILDAFQDLSPDQIQSFDSFTEALVKEEILEKSVASADRQPTSPLPKRKVPFELPSFSKYNDMQNLLLSDPIHDVDETGWPNLKADKV
jgi:Coenzyme PQQ synthesis protein D (PqqD)